MSSRRKTRKDGRPAKIRRDAKLLGFPERDRQLVAGWLQSDGCAACLQRIASQFHITCGTTTLYEAIAFWDSEARNDRVRAMALAQIDQEAAEQQFSPEQKMAALDRRMAEIKAADSDHEGYTAARYLIIADESAKLRGELEAAKLKLKERAAGQKDQEIWMAMEKLLNDAAAKLLDAALRKKADEINASTLSNAGRIAAMRRLAFADVDALQRSGKVEIPKA